MQYFFAFLKQMWLCHAGKQEGITYINVGDCTLKLAHNAGDLFCVRLTREQGQVMEQTSRVKNSQMSY